MFEGTPRIIWNVRTLSRDNVLGGRNQTKKTDKTVVHVTHEIINIWKGKIAHYIFEKRVSVVGWLFFNHNIDEETCTSKWVVFPYVLWCLRLPLCTVLSGTSHGLWYSIIRLFEYTKQKFNVILMQYMLNMISLTV